MAVSPESGRHGPFAHLHVASGYSLQYGSSHPHVLVQRAAELGMDLMALTDRDGTYGAVRFVKTCTAAGIRPVLGVDLALAPARRPQEQPQARGRRTPVRGGAFRSELLPRVVVLAAADGPGRGRGGWASLCRLVSAAHLEGRRRAAGASGARPVLTPDVLAEHLATGDLVLLLGPDSPVGRAVTEGRADLAEARLRSWQQVAPAGNVVVELTSHRLGAGPQGWGPGSAPHAARCAVVAQRVQVPVVLSNAVRHLDRADAPVVDVLDAARHLVPLGSVDLRRGSTSAVRGNAEGYLKSTEAMVGVAEEVVAHAGVGSVADLLASTRAVAQRCALDPAADLGLGEIHFPEFDLARGAAGSTDADALLEQRCVAAVGSRYGQAPKQRIWKRLVDELDTIRTLGYASYFLTVADITDMVQQMGIRRAARGSGAGSLVNYLLGISGVDPIRHDLLMERFLSPLRQSLPDIDIDVESARRLEVYDAILARYSDQRCVTVSMMETYRVRHAVRDVGAALGMPPAETDAMAKAFPHIRAKDARSALVELPELRRSGLGEQRLELFFHLVEKLDGLPRHVAMHPCGVLLSDATLLDRTPVQESAQGYPMSQFDKDDVEDLGLLKLDVLGIRMQSAMAHAVSEIARIDGVEVDLDDREQVPFADEATYDLISSSRTLGIFQLESPGQRELVGKSGIEDFEEIITDISLFRPGPVKSDMITPYLEAKQQWRAPDYLHPDLRPILRGTHGVVVFHEQVIEIFAWFTGVDRATADERRRAMGDTEGMALTRDWFITRARARGYDEPVVQGLWKILAGFAAFGFCKAHAAAFALPTFQSAWLKTHWPAHFLSGVLTHDPGMYPKRVILDDARQLGIGVRGLDVNASGATHQVEQAPQEKAGYAIRMALAEVKGISTDEVAQVLRHRPYTSLTDFWHRAGVSRPVTERLVLAGGFDAVHGLEASGSGIRRSGRLTRRDLLLQCSELDRTSRAGGRSQSSVQLSLELPEVADRITGLPEMTGAERLEAELEIVGMDVSEHVLDSYAEFLDDLSVVRSRHLLEQRPRTEILVAGVKVATQTPPVRSGRRVIFLTVDDSTGPVDAAFFSDVQAACASTVFNSWVLLVRGVLRRTGRRGVSLRATGAWSLPELHALWQSAPTSAEGIRAVHEAMAASDRAMAAQAAAEPATRSERVLVHTSGFRMSPYADIKPAGTPVAAGAQEVSRALWHRSPGSPG